MMSPEETTVLELIWSHYKKHGDWPRKGQLWRTLRLLGVDLDDFAAHRSWIRVESSSVSVGLEALLALPEVRDLLEPLPRFMRLLARRFVEQPDIDEPGSRKPEVKSSELFDSTFAIFRPGESRNSCGLQLKRWSGVTQAGEKKTWVRPVGGGEGALGQAQDVSEGDSALGAVPGAKGQTQA